MVCAWSATSWSPGSASSRSWTFSTVLAFAWTTAWSSTSTARRASLASTRQATSRITITPYLSGRSGWSTGITPSSKAPLPRATCSAGLSRTDEIHWFWSDQYEANLQYAGFHTKWDQLVVRGRLDSGSFLAFYINDGRVDAVVGLNRAKDVRRAIPLIKARRKLNLGQLQDESIDLRSLDASE